MAESYYKLRPAIKLDEKVFWYPEAPNHEFVIFIMKDLGLEWERAQDYGEHGFVGKEKIFLSRDEAVALLETEDRVLDRTLRSEDIIPQPEEDI